MTAYSFRHLPVHSLEDVTFDLEQLQGTLTELEAATAGTGLTPGAWTATTLGAKVENLGGGYQNASVRSEGSSAICRLRGVVKIKAGQKLEVGETLLTIPAGFRPATNIGLAAGTNAGGATAIGVTIVSTGVTTLSLAVAEGVAVLLDGLTFNLT